jgi:hypothetical protein
MSSVGPHANHHQRAQPIVLEPHAEVHVIDPDIHVVDVVQIRPTPPVYSASQLAVRRVIVGCDKPDAASPSRTGSAAWKSPVDNPRKWRIGSTPSPSARGACSWEESGW